MRKHILIQTILMALAAAILTLFPISAGAASIVDDLPTSAITSDEQSILWDRFSFQKITQFPSKDTIVAFDFSEEMGILLVTSGNQLLHLDRDGNVISAYHFECNGSVGVAWDSSDICLFFTRGPIIIKVTCDGELLEISRLDHLDFETQKRWNSLAFRQEKEVSSGTYVLRKDGLFPFKSENEYYTLEFISNSTGNMQILYDVSRTAAGKSLATVFLGLGIVVIISLIVKSRKTHQLNP